MIHLAEIYSVQAKAQRATLKGDLDRAIPLLKSAADQYAKLLNGIDHDDEDNRNLIKSLDALRGQVVRRVKELETILQNKQDTIEIAKKNGIRGSAGTTKDSEVSEEDSYKEKVTRLLKSVPTDTKLDSAILDLRQKLKILKINGNNIDLVTTPEQKLKYEIDLLGKIQMNYDMKLAKYETLYQKLVALNNGADITDLDMTVTAVMESATERGRYDDNADISELEALRRENAELHGQVDKLNNRWNELVESARKRKEREEKK